MYENKDQIGLWSKWLFAHYKEGHQILHIQEVLNKMTKFVDDMEIKKDDQESENKRQDSQKEGNKEIEKLVEE